MVHQDDDNISKLTSVSETDRMLYEVLANKPKVDLSKHKTRLRKDGETTKTYQPPPPVVPSKDPDDIMSMSSASASSLSSRSSLHSHHSGRSSRSSFRSRRSRSSSLRSRRSRRSRSLQSLRSGHSLRSSRSFRSRRHITDDVFTRGFSENDPEVIAEKRVYINELDKQRPGHRFTVDDKLADIEHEYNQSALSEDEKEMVAIFKEGLKLACSGIEFGNKKLGPFLKLHRWSDVVSRDVDKANSRYDEPLCNIYRLYFAGRGRTNPIAQLGMLLAFSMFQHHMKKSCNPNWEPRDIDGDSSAPPRPPPPPATPYNFPPSQFTQQRPTFPKPPTL